MGTTKLCNECGDQMLEHQNGVDLVCRGCYKPEKKESINPTYYGGADNVYEAIKVIQAHELNFCLGNVIKYVLRAGKKDNNTKIADLKKALHYLEFEINNLQNEKVSINPA